MMMKVTTNMGCGGNILLVERVIHDDPPRRGRNQKQDAIEQVVVRRTLGDHVAYDSVWTKRQGGSTPLRYRLKTFRCGGACDHHLSRRKRCASGGSSDLRRPV